MSAYLTDSQLKILINTIGALETGGQIFGRQRYNAFASPYKNTPGEHSSTAGAFQEFGENLRQLLLRIQKEYPSVFKKYDTDGIAKDISGKAWSASNPYDVYEGTSKANAIIKIISSKEGIIVQDKRIAELIEKYLKYIVEELKVTNTQAAMFLAQCEHLGGKTPLTRIVNRATNKNNIDALYSSLLKDQNDKSNNNQIGDKIFQTRHRKALEWISEKVSSTDVVNTVKNSNSSKDDSNGKEVNTKMTVNDLIEKLISVFKSESGYLEKKSNSNLDSKTGNAGYNNYTKYWRDIANWGLGNFQTQYWCASFIHWCFVVAFGLTNAKKLLLHAPYINCQTGYNKFKAQGRVYTSPKIGDIVVFWNGSRYSHTEFVIGVTGKTFITCGGNTSVSGAVANGGGVYYGKTYVLNTSKHKFLRPDYSSILNSVESSTSSPVVSTRNWLQIGDTGSEVKSLQTKLNKCGYDCGTADGIFGTKTKSAVIAFQKAKRLTADGLAGKETMAALNTAYSKVTSKTTSGESARTKWVKNLQKAIGAKQDGIAGSETHSKCPTLKYGSTGTVVKLLQQYIDEFAGIDVSGGIDGDFGSGTKNAVIKFQKANGLSADGIVGRNTWKKILKL